MKSRAVSTTRRALLDLLEASRLSACLYAAAKLEIPDLLNAGPRSCDALARMTGTHAPSLYRLLRALAGAGLLDEGEEQHFALTPVGSYLQRDSPDSLRPWVLMFHDVNFRPYGELLHTVKTGESAFTHVMGSELFPYFAEHPEVGTIFDEAMTVETTHIAQAVLDAYDFSSFRRIVDVGGGHGILLAAILRAHPAMHGVLFDRTRVVERARRVLDAAGLADRSDCEGGSFLKSVPSGCDAYVLKNIIHDWNDEQAVEILSNCRRAMHEHGKILLVERLLQAGGATSLQTLCADVDMLVLGGGHSARERTEAEYGLLCRAAGCELARVIPIRSDHDYYVMEVVPR